MNKTVLMMAIVLALTACDDVKNEPIKKKRQDIPLTESEIEMARSNNDFAYNLFRELNAVGKNTDNTFFSPISVSYAFSMLNNGAGGNTMKEIQHVLGFDGRTLEEINAYNQKMLVASRDLDPQVSVETANSIWVRKDYPVLPSFTKVNKLYYDAQVETVDFSLPQTVNEINKWASQHTNGRIPSVLDELNPDAVIYLLNALCFKGEWSTPFEKNSTTEERFSNADGSSSNVPMMRRFYNTIVFDGDNYKAIDLPYGNSAFSMFLLLPDENETTASVLSGLSQASWDLLMKNREGYHVSLKLPRFQASYDTDLNDALIALGMPSAFDSSKADFSSLSDASIFITKAFQKVRIEVDEEGTKAEAVTVVEGEVSSPGPVRLPEMDFFLDRPFIYMIKEVSSDAIFFIGEVNKL